MILHPSYITQSHFLGGKGEVLYDWLHHCLQILIFQGSVFMPFNPLVHWAAMRERSWRQRKVQALYRYCKCVHLSFISNPPFLKIWNFSYCLLLHWEIHYTGLWSSADQCNCFGSPTLLYGYKLCETLHVPRQDTAIACLVLIQKSCSMKNIKGGLPSWAFADNFTVSLKKDRMLDLFKGGGKRLFLIMIYNVTNNFSNFFAT